MESLKVYRLDTALLRDMPISSLREIAKKTTEKAIPYLLDSHTKSPQTLSAMGFLYVFGHSTIEPISHNDLATLIEALKEVWAYIPEPTTNPDTP